MEKTVEWMPVFGVIPAVRTYYAAHPNEKHVEKHKQERAPEERLQRVGTAVALPDGGYRITLHSRTAGRQLLIRPPKPNERIDFSGREE